MRKGFLFIVLCLSMVLEHGGASAAQPLKVTAVKPGRADAREVHQITVTFNQPVVPLGDFEQLAEGLPVSITPSMPCHWRWLNRQTLACELDEPLPGSNAYRVLIEAGFKAMGGPVLEQAHETTFTTEKWRLVNRRPRWLAPDLPVFYLAFNQPASRRCPRPKPWNRPWAQDEPTACSSTAPWALAAAAKW
jgi:hypothetical protein